MEVTLSKKITALLKLKNDQNVEAILDRILKFFYDFHGPYEALEIMGFFDFFENEIKKRGGKIPVDSAHFRIIGKAIEQGLSVLHAYLANFLGKDFYTKLLHECVYQVARANKPIMQVTWQEGDGSYQATILERYFDSEIIYEALCGTRKKAFSKMWGEENRKFLEDYFYTLISGPGVLYDIDLGEGYGV